MNHTSDSALHIDIVLTESVLSDRFIAALRSRFLPEPFFYWSPLSVRAWLSLCRDGAYRNYVRSDSLVRAHAQKIVDAFPNGPIEVISLGAGQGTKDMHVLKCSAADGHPVTYIPVDSGQTLLELACGNARACGVAHRGVKADMTDMSHLNTLAPRPDGPPRAVMILGNTLGAFEPSTTLRALRALLREGDLLVVDGELGTDCDTRAGYENPENRAFALAPLRSIGIADADGTLSFEFGRGAGPGMHRLEKSFLAHVDLSLHVGGEFVTIPAGERIRMNHSGKYERHGFLTALADGHFEPTAEFYSEDGRFIMVLARPLPERR